MTKPWTGRCGRGGNNFVLSPTGGRLGWGPFSHNGSHLLRNLLRAFFRFFFADGLKHVLQEDLFRDCSGKLYCVVDDRLGHASYPIGLGQMRELLYLYYVCDYARGFHRHRMGHTGHDRAILSGRGYEHLDVNVFL